MRILGTCVCTALVNYFSAFFCLSSCFVSAKQGAESSRVIIIGRGSCKGRTALEFNFYIYISFFVLLLLHMIKRQRLLRLLLILVGSSASVP